MPTSTPSDLPYLAPSEWQVFYVLSKFGPKTIHQIATELIRIDPGFSAGYTSILSYVQRLIRKGYVHQQRIFGRTTAHSYSARVPFELALRRHVERFLAEFTFEDPETLRLVREVFDEHASAVPKNP